MPPLHHNWATSPCLFMLVWHPRQYIEISVMLIFLHYVTSQRTVIGCVDVNARAESMFSFTLFLSLEIMTTNIVLVETLQKDVQCRYGRHVEKTHSLDCGRYICCLQQCHSVKDKCRGNVFSVFKTRTEMCTTSRAKLSSKLVLCNVVNLDVSHARLLPIQTQLQASSLYEHFSHN
jgi:hypothetical protein